MKPTIKLFAVILLLTSYSSCKKDNPFISSCGKEFYYYYDQKIDLLITKQKITVGFIDTLSFQEVKNILDNYPFIESFDQEDFIEHMKLACPNLKDNLTCKQINQGIIELTENSNVSYANLFLLSQKNTLLGITDKFVVKISDSSQYTNLQATAIQTNTTIIRQNEFNSEIYHLSADKNSNGNALRMANYFYETGEFEFCEASFLNIIKRN